MEKGEIMPFIKIWIHLIWSTKERQPLISKKLKKELFRHFRDNAKKKDIYLDFINGTKDHVHLLVSLKANQNISKITQLIKGESSHWINENKLTGAKFEWQDEYIAVSVSESIVNRVREYIQGVEYCKFAITVYLYLIHQYILIFLIIKYFIPPPKGSR